MPFVKGQPRPPNAGRRKGSVPKINQAVSEKLAALGCDPIEGMARIALDSKNPIEIRAKMYSELSQYVHPKRRAVEISGPGGTAVELNVSGLELLKSRIDSIATRVRAGEATPRSA